ncbi:septation inhibitor protein [Parenemella sanctibonifatiensis]|uniref:Cell division protein CrgA n=1 Tax=Parenemella sanctibonifatiensis TaxID=2016505 RepID=A0A255EDF0_9ACTN|nr:septation inhibitor protein [Parenemella sanctibonifatiensis]
MNEADEDDEDDDTDSDEDEDEDEKGSGKKSSGSKKSAKTPAKKAASKKKVAKKPKVKGPASRRWVPPTFITVGLLGVIWLVVYYIAGQYVPFMNTLGDWNILIGMGLMGLAFALSTLWK